LEAAGLRISTRTLFYKKKKKKKKKNLYFYMVLLGLYTKNKKCQSGIKKNIQLTYGKPNPKKMGVHQQVSWTKVQ
jgi:hypothetical protein